MIAKNSVIIFDVKGRTGYLPRTEAGVRQNVIDGLTPFFEVQDVSLSTSTVLSDPLHQINTWPYTAVVRAKTQADYGHVRDVDSIVAHAFYTAGGELPTVTARGYEKGQSEDKPTGLSLTTALILVAVSLVALAVVKLT
jgi:hypothetical protein